jgi:hypothetical protein
MYFWQILNGIVFTVGAFSMLAVGLLPPKSPNLLGIAMMLVGFLFFGMNAFLYWYATEDNFYYHYYTILRLERADLIVEAFCFPLMWWLTCHLLFSLGNERHHNRTCLNVFSAINIVGILVFYAIFATVMVERGLYWYGVQLPDIAEIVLFFQRIVYWIVSLVALIMLKVKHHRGELGHVSIKCLTGPKLVALLVMKIVILITYVLAHVFRYSDIMFFIWNITLVVWFSMVVRVASTQHIDQANGVRAQPALYQQPVFPAPNIYAQPVNNQYPVQTQYYG